MHSPKLSVLHQYHFSRDAFRQIFNEVFTDDECNRVYVACQKNTHCVTFSLFYHDCNFYILHRDSGVLIYWRQCIGRANTCNREDFTLDDLRVFFQLLKKDMRGDLYA